MYGHPALGTWWGPFNYSATAVYAGALALPLAAAGLAGWRDRRVLGLSVIVAFCFLSAYHLPGVHDLLAALPLLGRAAHHRLIFGLELGLALLGAVGIDRWLAGKGRGLLAGAALAAATLGTAWIVLGGTFREHGLEAEQLGWSVGRDRPGDPVGAVPSAFDRGPVAHRAAASRPTLDRPVARPRPDRAGSIVRQVLSGDRGRPLSTGKVGKGGGARRAVAAECGDRLFDPRSSRRRSGEARKLRVGLRGARPVRRRLPAGRSEVERSEPRPLGRALGAGRPERVCPGRRLAAWPTPDRMHGFGNGRRRSPSFAGWTDRPRA